ncbi:MAG: ATP-binding cassette domain-containing protein, partial [Sutterellaceae bacterium]|nr:ATP-binding cassette domain-containing protein [Burkholderiaceae bacterium]MDW8430122.1 ATP-binding cassette domain-containing protein [Sutterellaceae bacterium]
MSDDILIEIDHVTFGYDERVVLADVSLRFARGRVTAILGSSGCGKTTLLRLIGGVIKPQSGRVLFDGAPVDAEDRAALYRLRRRIGMLFQFGALFTDMTVFDNVAFP